jgi:Sulfotransferase family
VSDGTRRLVLVVGIGRSGSSLLTGLLGRLGFHIPQPEVKADDTNPRGFGEPRWVVDFHTRLMRERRISRFDSRPAAWQIAAEAADDDAVVADLTSWLEVQFVGVDNVVVKDPRLDWFLPLWSRCADALGVQTSLATMLRHPAAVVRSAREHYGSWQTDASRAASWANATLHTEQATRGARRVFVRFDDLLDDWSREISRVGERLELPWLVDFDRSRHPEADRLVDPGLRRSTIQWDGLAVPDRLRALLDDAWPQVSRLAEAGGDSEATWASLDSLREAYVELYAEAEAIAQSSVTAVKPRRGGAGPAVAARADRSSPSRRRLVAQIVPSRFRERLAASGGLGALPVQIALLVPVRYRERVPLPVVRAFLRLMRGLRRI